MTSLHSATARCSSTCPRTAVGRHSRSRSEGRDQPRCSMKASPGSISSRRDWSARRSMLTAYTCRDSALGQQGWARTHHGHVTIGDAPPESKGDISEPADGQRSCYVATLRTALSEKYPVPGPRHRRPRLRSRVFRSGPELNDELGRRRGSAAPFEYTPAQVALPSGARQGAWDCGQLRLGAQHHASCAGPCAGASFGDCDGSARCSRVPGACRHTSRRRTHPARSSCAAARPNPVAASAPSSVLSSPLPQAVGSSLVASALPPPGGSSGGGASWTEGSGW